MSAAGSPGSQASPQFLRATLLSHHYQELDLLPAYAGLAAVVSVCRTVETDELVAVKVIDKRKLCSTTIQSTNGLGDKSELERARGEIVLHGSLPKHQNVVPLLASEESIDTLFLVTPFAPDGDLWKHTRFSATLSEIEARNCIEQVAYGLKSLHDRKIVHADIKPHNILLFRAQGSTSERFIAQLCDFGLSEEAVLKGDIRMIPYTGLRGTSGYFSPEVVNQENYGFAVDVFALGIVLFRLLGGYEPFYPPTNFCNGVEFEDTCWEEISKDCKDLIRSMLELDQYKRVTVSEMLAHKWFSAELPNDQESILYFFPANNIPGPIEPGRMPGRADVRENAQDAMDVSISLCKVRGVECPSVGSTCSHANDEKKIKVNDDTGWFDGCKESRYTDVQDCSQELSGGTPLHLATAQGNDKIVELLLEKGAHVDAQTTSKWTALHLAAGNNAAVIAQMLLGRSAEVDARDEWYGTPLHIAATKGHEKMVDILVENKADVDAKDTWQNTALHYATKSNHTNVVKSLLCNGANSG